MATKNQRYGAIGIALCVVGGVLLVIALAQELFGFTVFRESPWLVGSAIGFIGVLLAVGNRRKAVGDTHANTQPRL
jgi:hypothetical protein